MAVLQMLPEMVRPEKLFGVVALSKLMHLLQVHDPDLPVLLCCYRNSVTARGGRGDTGPQELVPTVPAGICLVGTGGRIMKCRSVARQRSARPGMAAKVKRILVPLGLVLIFKTVPTIRTLVLLFLLVGTKYRVRVYTSLLEGREFT